MKHERKDVEPKLAVDIRRLTLSVLTELKSPVRDIPIGSIGRLYITLHLVDAFGKCS